MFRPVRTSMIALATGGLAVALTAGPASANSSAIEVPAHELATTPAVSMAGASSRGVVVTEASPLPYGPALVLSGPEGTQLARRPAIEAGNNTLSGSVPQVLTVAGDTIVSYRSAFPGACNCDWQEVHRTNLRTGADRDDGIMPPPGAYTQGSYLSDAIGSFSQFPFPPPSLKRYPPLAAPAPGVFLSSTQIAPYPDGANAVAMDADAGTALIAYFQLSDPNDPDSTRIYHLALVDLATGALTEVTHGPDEISRIVLSDDLVVWASQADGGPVRINQRARSGGPITSYTATEGIVDDTKLVVVQGEIGYLAPLSGGSALRIVTGATARTVSLPAGSAGLASDGTRFLTATGGTAAVAGVYGVPATGTGGPTRVATLPPATYPLSNVTLSGGLLHYTDSSRTDKPGQPLWMRTVSGRHRPKLGPESLMQLPTGNGVPTYVSYATSMSDGRAAVMDENGDTIRLFDEDSETGIVTTTSFATPDASGPDTLIGSDVYLPDGEKSFSLPLDGDSFDDGDLYGSTAIYSVETPDYQESKVYLDGAGQAQPTLLATFPEQSGGNDCFSPMVSIWGASVAWTNCGETAVTVEDLTTKATRTVPVATTENTLQGITLGEGGLAWSTATATDVIDLTRSASQPVQVAGEVFSLALDDHRIALATDPNETVGDPVLVEQLPFGTVKYRPRLIDTYAPEGFTPAGPKGTWRPQFDVSKPLRDVELTITDGKGRKVAVLAGTAPDGSIRDLTWNGQDRKGVAVPAGVYTWTLTARADDGDGRLIGPRGEPAVTGTVEVDAAQTGQQNPKDQQGKQN